MAAKTIDKFDDVLQLITDEQERQAILKVVEKYPEIKGRIEVTATDAKSYNEWYKNEWPVEQQKLVRANAELEAANKLVDELKAGKGGHEPAKGDEGVEVGDMTIEQIEDRMLARLRKDGFVTRAEAEAMADQKATAAAAAAQGRVYTHGLPMVERMMAVQDKFRKDFGKEMDRQSFGKFIEDNKFADVDKAYEAFTRPEYENKVKTEAFEQGKLAGAKETAERLGKENAANAMRGLPTDMTGSNGFVSRPGAPPEPVEMKDIPDNYQLGQRGGFKLANAIAAQIERDRASGKTV